MTITTTKNMDEANRKNDGEVRPTTQRGQLWQEEKKRFFHGIQR